MVAGLRFGQDSSEVSLTHRAGEHTENSRLNSGENRDCCCFEAR
jgi:hypothetical protein